MMLGSPATRGLTIDELTNDPALNPRTFAGRFRDFEYSYQAQVQPPSVFLSKRAGDCDDYATLAAEVLNARGFTARLIAVRMPTSVHVVCYIEESKAYLDYNRRTLGNGLVESTGSMSEIADKVAISFNSSWSAVSEFTYRAGSKRLLRMASRSKPIKPKATVS